MSSGQVIYPQTIGGSSVHPGYDDPQPNGIATPGNSANYSREDHVHPTDTTRVAANDAITGATATKITYDAKGLVTSGTSLADTDIPNLDAAKITSGTFDIARIPAAAIERMVPVADQNARYALTTDTVQLGDTVKQLDTGIMYVVTDTANLGNSGGYTEYSAGTAASVPWSGVSSKPNTLSGYGISDAVPSSRTVNSKSLSTDISLDKTDIGLGNVLNLEQKSYHGWASLPATPTFSGTTITIPGSTPYDIYIGGVKSTINADKTFDLSTSAEWDAVTKANNYGQWYIWINSNLTLGASKTAWSILNTAAIPAVTIYLQDAGGANYEGIISKEWHDYRRNLIEHRNQHESWGAQYVSGFNSITIGGGSPTVNSFSLLGGTIRDEDLHQVITNPQTQCRIAYRGSGGAAMIFDAAGTTYAKTSGTVPYYDNNGTLTTLGGNQYGIYWIYATTRIATPIVSVMGQGTYNNIANAQLAPQPTLTGITTAEWKLLYRVIVRNAGGNLTWIQSDPFYNISTGPAISAGTVAATSAGNVSYNPTSPDTSTNVQTAIDARALLNGSTSQDFSAQNLTVAKKQIWSVGTVSAGATITIPNDYMIVIITSDSTSAANALTMPTGTNGQPLVVHNADEQATTGAFTIPAGGTAMFLYFLDAWHRITSSYGA